MKTLSKYGCQNFLDYSNNLRKTIVYSTKEPILINDDVT